MPNMISGQSRNVTYGVLQTNIFLQILSQDS